MKRLTITMPLAIGILLLAFLSWTGIGFFVKKLYAERVAYGNTQRDIETLQAQALAATRSRALLRNTIAERQALEALVPSDMVGSINRVVSLAGASGVTLSVENAAEDASVKAPLQAARIGVQGSGSFENILRTIALLEAIPSSAALQNFTLEYGTGGTQKYPWHLSAQIAVFSFADSSTTTATTTTP